MKPRLFLRKDDTVVVLTGVDRAKKGKILRVHPDANKAVVEGVNTRYRYVRSKSRNQKGERVSYNAPLPVANLALVCPECGKATRAAYTVSPDGTKNRRCTKCKKTLS